VHQHRLGWGHVFFVFDNGIAYRKSVTSASQRRPYLLRFLLLIPTLTYAVLDYYVFILTFVLALMAEWLYDYKLYCLAWIMCLLAIIMYILLHSI